MVEEDEEETGRGCAQTSRLAVRLGAHVNQSLPFFLLCQTSELDHSLHFTDSAEKKKQRGRQSRRIRKWARLCAARGARTLRSLLFALVRPTSPSFPPPSLAPF